LCQQVHEKTNVAVSYRFSDIGDRLKTFMCVTLSTFFCKESVVVDTAEHGIDNINTHGGSCTRAITFPNGLKVSL